MFRKSAIFRPPTTCIESGALRAAWVFFAFMWTYCSTNFKPASDGVCSLISESKLGVSRRRRAPAELPN